MKKLMILFLALAMGFGLAVTAKAETWTNVVDLSAMFGGEIHQGFEEVVYTWEHLTPPDFEAPPDLVTSATLSVSVGWIDTVGDDHLDVQILSLPLDVESAFYTYVLDIGTLLVNWPNGQNLVASLTILENEELIGHPEWNGDLLLGNSTLNMEYQNVPEPAILFLLGPGLLGAGLFGLVRMRRKLKK